MWLTGLGISRLCQKKNAQKKLAVTVFSFPPDKGNVGTAAYLNVFGSIYKVLENLKREGYDVGELPENGEELIKTVRLLSSLCHQRFLEGSEVTDNCNFTTANPVMTRANHLPSATPAVCHLWGAQTLRSVGNLWADA